MSDEKDPTLEDEPTVRRRSFSQLSQYIQCGEAFRLKRIVRPRVPERPAPWLTMGLAVHEACEKWEQSYRQSDMRSDYIEAFTRIKQEQLEKQPDLAMWINPYRGKNVMQALDASYDKGLEQIDAYLAWQQDPDNEMRPIVDPEDGDVWVEVPFEIMLGEVPVVGYIDIVEESGMPIDLKTGDRKHTKALQLGLYKVALEKQYQLMSETGQFFYTKVDGRSKYGLSEHYDTTRYTEVYLTELFAAAERGIQAEVFLPNPTDFCGICEVAEFCREKGMPGRIIPLNWQDVEEPWWAPEEIDPDATA